MRDDCRSRRPAVVAETPLGVIYEMDVWLTADELAGLSAGACVPSSRRVYEPWLRLTCGAEVSTAAGIEIVDQDDGA